MWVYFTNSSITKLADLISLYENHLPICQRLSCYYIGKLNQVCNSTPTVLTYPSIATRYIPIHPLSISDRVWWTLKIKYEKYKHKFHKNWDVKGNPTLKQCQQCIPSRWSLVKVIEIIRRHNPFKSIRMC